MTFSSDNLAATGLAVVGVVLIFYVIRTIVRNIHSGIDFIEGWFRGVAKPEMASHARISFMDAFGNEIESARLERRPVNIDQLAELLVDGLANQRIEQRAAAARLIPPSTVSSVPAIAPRRSNGRSRISVQASKRLAQQGNIG